MEVSRGIIFKINIATMSDTRRAGALFTVKVIVFLNARWLGIEIMRGPKKLYQSTERSQSNGIDGL
jgi:hypothetical protein